MRVHAQIALLAAVAAVGCSAPGVPPATVKLADAPLVDSSHGFRVTRHGRAACGPDYVERQPDALADLDHDGSLDRVSVVREGRSFVVSIHRLPALEVTRSFTVRGDYVEVGTTRWKGRTEGDLWLHVGKASDDAGKTWSNDVLHLEKGGLVPVMTNVGHARFDLDLDADGKPDPIADTSAGPRAYLAGAVRALPDHVVPSTLQGMRLDNGQSEPVDLDGDGDLDLLQQTVSEDTFAGIEILELPSLRVVFHKAERVWSSEIATWEGRPVIAANLAETLFVLAADANHTPLFEWKDASYTKVLPFIDPAGDDTVLAVQGLDTSLVTKASAPHPLHVRLIGPAGRAHARLSPVRIDADETPDLAGIRVLSMGDGSLGGQGTGTYEIVLLSPDGQSLRTVVHREVQGETDAGAGLVDLDGDGRYELVVHERGAFYNCDLSTGGGMTEVVFLARGDGEILWKDKPRSMDFGGRVRRMDTQAHTRPLVLSADGRSALRVRAGDEEWYVVPENLPLPDPMPACLE